jgi:site-specific recombinase XerD
MIEKSFGLLFFLKQSKNQKSESRYVFLRITVNGKFKEISTKKQWEISRWSSNSGRALGKKEDSRTLNAYLESLSAQVYFAKQKLNEGKKEITAEAIKDFLLGKVEPKKMILEIFQRHNDQMAALVGREFAPATLTRYKTCLKHTRGFIETKCGKSDMELDNLNFEFISEFSFWLKTVRGCGQNATVKYLTNFKKIVINCVNNGWIPRDPFAGFKLSKKDIERDVLYKEEIQAIADKQFDIERLAQVRDIFLFSCYTGLAYIDVKQLKRSNLLPGIDSEPWIMTIRQKNDSSTRIPLLPKALEIADFYEKHPSCLASGSVLPVLSNQKMNAYLKEIADLCGIKKKLTFHVARHTFATTVTLTNGVPLETVSKMLGHKSLKQTQHYAKIVDLKISEDMKVLKTKL